jgi:hypothetical protein
VTERPGDAYSRQLAAGGDRSARAGRCRTAAIVCGLLSAGTTAWRQYRNGMPVARRPRSRIPGSHVYIWVEAMCAVVGALAPPLASSAAGLLARWRDGRGRRRRRRGSGRRNHSERPAAPAQSRGLARQPAHDALTVCPVPDATQTSGYVP